MAVFVGSINSPKIRSTRLRIHKWFAYSEHILAIEERPTKFITMNICFLDSSSLIAKEKIMLRTPIKILRYHQASCQNEISIIGSSHYRTIPVTRLTHQNIPHFIEFGPIPWDWKACLHQFSSGDPIMAKMISFILRSDIWGIRTAKCTIFICQGRINFRSKVKIVYINKKVSNTIIAKNTSRKYGMKL